MKKLFMLSIISVLFLAISNVVFALSIGIVDYQKVFSNASAVKAASKQLEKKYLPEKNKILAQQDKIQKMIADYQKNGSIMTDKARQLKEDEISQMREDYLKASQDYQKEVLDAQNAAMQKVLDQINATVASIAKKKNIDVIFAKTAVAYSGNGVDITDDVIRSMK